MVGLALVLSLSIIEGEFDLWRIGADAQTALIDGVILLAFATLPILLPLWLYRVAMLLWALWLAASLVRGVGPGWRAFSEGGLWRPIVFKKPSARPKGEAPAAPSSNAPAAR